MIDNGLDLFQKYGYRQDREQRLRDIASGTEDSLAMEAANQIKHLKSQAKEMAEWIYEAVNTDGVPKWVRQSGKSLLDNNWEAHE